MATSATIIILLGLGRRDAKAHGLADADPMADPALDATGLGATEATVP